MALYDTFGRLHDSLRISVTDRCNIRCYYCMPEQVSFGPRDGILTFEEIERFVRIAASEGVNKLRLTGGEPLLRKDLPTLVHALAAVPGISDISLTTNGVLLERDAQSLYEAGLRRINVHVDTLDPARFRTITRRDDLARVLRGIECARELGYRIKINAVALKGVTEEDILPLATFGRERGIEIRFIEFMPLDAQGLWDLSRVLTGADILRVLSAEFGELEAVPDADPRAPATEYRYKDNGRTIGVIASVTRPFCGNCNRLRLTADGHLRYCLFAIEETDVKRLLRSGTADDLVLEAIRATTRDKWAGHEITQKGFVPPPRPMYAIGG
ncbi:MAG TPA: GTP 3',8-cyclase MoaA [Bryobacteraceae bacterium]|nr:GTP 3',8-cyclase MoaA [Bryobacteraceae bacterium]